MIKAYAIFGASAESPVRMLSGGNMQKVVLARELSSKPRLLIVDQPTRGLDVGSIEFVHRMILSQRDQGVAVLLVSVELEEILSLSDRVGVMYAGRLQGELEGKQITQEAIGMLMVGGSV
jgi:simple sugar transport system ATP-binding protein